MTTNPCTTLTACRVCSAEDRAITYNGGQGGISYIRCACCNFGAFGDTEAEAIAAWNTRLQAGQGEGWRPIETAPKDGSFQWIGRDGDFPFADWMRWRNDRWEFSDGSHLDPAYGALFYHPLPAPPALPAPEGGTK